MSFIDSICQNFNLTGASFSFRLVMLGEAGAYLEGVKSIICFSCEEIVVRVGSGVISLLGSNLKIKKYCLGDMVVVGKLTEVKKHD